MPSQPSAPDPTSFDTVDAADDPGALITFLEAADTIPGLRAAKSAMLERLRLAQARTALDVGCGFGADVVEMAGTMPHGGQAFGVDVSETMIAEARSRTADIELDVSFRTGDAEALPYADGTFDACRLETVLQHLHDPQHAIREMARVTRPGGRVAALEFDQGTTMLDHPDARTTQAILTTFAETSVHGWIGRRLPRLFREAGLTEVEVHPTVILSDLSFFRILLNVHLARLRDDGVLTDHQAHRWWSELEAQADAGHFLGGATAFLVAATRP